MAGIATLECNLKITGLGDTVNILNSQALTVPVEHQEGYTVLATATTTGIQLFDMVDHIALAKIFGVYLKAEVGTVLIAVDTAGTATLTASTADLVLNTSEATYIPVNPGGNLGMVIDGLSVTDAFSWTILGSA